MPGTKRGSRGKRSEKYKQHTQLLSRSAEADQSRLQKAIKRSTELNQLSGASSSITLPAEQQEQTTPSGVIPVSIDSDSDQALSPSGEGLSSTPPTGVIKSIADHPSVKEPDPKVKSLGPTTDSSYDGYAIDKWAARPNGTNGL